MKRETRLSHKGTHYFDVTNGAGTPAPTYVDRHCASDSECRSGDCTTTTTDRLIRASISSIPGFKYGVYIPRVSTLEYVDLIIIRLNGSQFTYFQLNLTEVF